jgi:8-amino-3,8-dideoxy-alpha-D-manno-octulosonate transaminase
MKNLRWPASFSGIHWYDKQEERAVVGVVRGGAPFRYYGLTPPRQVLALEAAARKFYGRKHALGVNSGTGGLCAAVRALGVGPGDEVIVPTYMWVSTIGAVVMANAIPVLCEVDDSFTMDPADLARKITRRTKLIVPVHMSGAPCDMRRIMALARQHRVAVLEDCAQANGGSFRGRKLGTFGDIGMFSFQMNKNCSAGEGGLLITNDPDLDGQLRAAHDVGVPWRQGGGPDPDTGYVTWGDGRRMSELIGAVAGVQLRKLPGIVRCLRASKRRILAQLPGIETARVNDPAGDTGSFLILKLENARAARQVAKQLQPLGAVRLADFGMHVYYNIPQLVQKLPLSPAGNPWRLPANRASRYRYGKGASPQSDALFERSVLVAVPSCLTRAQEDWAARLIRAAWRKAS